MSEEAQDPDWSAKAYIQRMVEAGQKAEREAARSRRRQKGLVALEESDPTNPLALIVEAIRDNSDAIKAAAAEMGIVRQTMAESERKIALRADNASSEIRSLTLAVQQLTAREDTIRRLRGARWVWGCIGLILGAVLTSVVLNELPMWWRQIFG